MIAQLFQALDMRASGRMTKRQLKTILTNYGRNGGPGVPSTRTSNFVSDSEVMAIIRRMDADGDDEVSFSDFFSSIFGGAAGARGTGQGYGYTSQQSSNQHGNDIETDMPIFLEDTLADASKTLSYRLPHRDAEGHVSEINRTLNVKIPAGVVNGERIRLKGQGGQGTGSGENGDLYLRIRMVPHPLFDLEAHNLVITVPLAPWEAALGTTIQVPTLSGKIKLTIPANSQTGQRLRIKGKGLVRKQGHGDLYALLKVVMPVTTNDQSKEHWQQLARDAAFDPRMEWSK